MKEKHSWPCPHCGGAIEGRGPQSEATRRKISRTMRGRQLTPEHRAALVAAALRRSRRRKKSHT